MNSNLQILVIALVIILFLSVVWYIIYTNYLKRNQVWDARTGFINNNQPTNHRLLSVIKTCASWIAVSVVCAIVLPNTDDDVGAALRHIGPSQNAGKLLENLYEQTGI